MNTEFYVDSINPWGRSASGWQAQNRPPVITHKSTSQIQLSSPSAPASGGMKRVSGCPLPGATAAGCRLTVSASESSRSRWRPTVCRAHFYRKPRGQERVSCPSTHTPAPTPAQGSPLSHHLYSTPRCEPHPSPLSPGPPV